MGLKHLAGFNLLTRNGTVSSLAPILSVLSWQADKKATYLKHVCAEKIKRVRTTVGGDRVQYKGETAAYTAGLKKVKLLWNAVLSKPQCKLMTMDVKNFYLHSRLHSPEYAWIPLS